MRSMTKSPLAVAREALAVAERSLPLYSSPYSRRDFTQHQLFAILVLRYFFRMDYRGIVQLLGEFSDLRELLGLAKIPHYSTLCYAEERLLKKTASPNSWEHLWIGPEGWGLSPTAPRASSTPPAWRAAMSAGTTSGAGGERERLVFTG